MQGFPYMNNIPPMINMPMGRPQFPQGAPPLYIGNLDDTVYEEQLFSHFSKYGPIHSLKIAKDSQSGRSRGFGYINFMQAKDAENARLLSQYEKIGKNPIRLMYKRNVRDNNEGNVYITNIDTSVSFKELHNLFAQVGNVLAVKVATNRKGESLGYGYVQMEKKEDATRAIESLNGHKLREKEISAAPFVPKGQRNVSANKNIYVKGLPANKSKGDIEGLLTEKFGKYGKIVSHAAQLHEKDNRWFAFICYENSADAEEAIKNLHDTDAFQTGETLYVGWHQSRYERDAELKKKHLNSKNDTNLYVKNLKPEVTEQTLRAAFSQFGEIVSVAVSKKEIKTDDTRAHGFVAFKVAQDAHKAQSEGHKAPEVKDLFLEGQEPYINFWQPKGQRDQFKASKQRQPYGGRRPGGYNGYPGSNMFPPMPMGYMRMGGFPNMHMMPPQYQRRGYVAGGARHPLGPGRRPVHGGRAQGGAPGPQGYAAGGRVGGGYRQNNRSYGQNQNQYQPRPQQDKRAPYTGAQGAQGQQQTAQGQQRDQTKETRTQPTLDVNANLTVANLKDKLDDFLKLDAEKQRNILGELLYPKIVVKSGINHAPKITGMLVDFDVLTVQDILEMLEDDQVLHERIQEAQDLINQEGDA